MYLLGQISVSVIFLEIATYRVTKADQTTIGQNGSGVAARRDGLHTLPTKEPVIKLCIALKIDSN
jgi:hypothetical protein